MKNPNLYWLAAVVILASCNIDSGYSLMDFRQVEKIDAHYHIYTSENNSLAQAEQNNFTLININTFSDGCERVVGAHQNLVLLKQKHGGATEFTATFCLDGWNTPGWVENTIAWIDQCVADGAIAVKVWKNVGMEFRDSSGEFVMIDHPQFEPVFRHLEENGIPLVAHLGEPLNCWLPLDEMTTRNDSSYFARNPQYHMYLHPDFPSYEEQLAARDRMLKKHPNLTFIACHLASLEWSVDEMAAFLDKFPNASMDMAARMGQLFYQTAEDRNKVRNFFIKYQDRLLYGTDVTDNGGDRASFEETLQETWHNHWVYLVSDATMSSPLVDKPFQGLNLPRMVIDKIYAENARKWYKL